MTSKAKGYRVERKIRMEFEKRGWLVVRAGASLGDADLICLKDGKCLLVQVKSTKKDALYYYGPIKGEIAGFPYILVVDFGYGTIRVTKPKRKILRTSGISLEEFLEEKNK
jgi:hypothetical protein